MQAYTIYSGPVDGGKEDGAAVRQYFCALRASPVYAAGYVHV